MEDVEKFENSLKKAGAFCAVIFISVVLVALWSYIGSMFGLKDDGTVEEVIELLVEKELDLPQGSFDLTPESKE